MFNFNLYSTPLLFGFAQGWIYALLFMVRAWRHARRSDALFGCLLIAMTFEIWEYMLGFGGVEVLWQELEFFPRTFGLLLPPLAWFYLKAQFNTDFRFQWADLKHAVPFLVYAAYHTIIFAQGPAFVEVWKTNVHFPFGLDLVEIISKFLIEIGYFYQSYRLYRQYRQWAPSQFSNLETVNFRWFRNFSVAFVASGITGWAMTLTDLWLDLDFWHDWWDELFTAGLIYYLCITGYAQTQPRSFLFEPASVEPANRADLPKTEKITESELQQWRGQIESLMSEHKPWLDPELTLAELARRLRTNPSVLSAVINRAFGKNFNDYVNEYRVEAVKVLLRDPDAGHLSLLGMGLECGFNSKSTFNRAFRKSTGMAPSEFNR